MNLLDEQAKKNAEKEQTVSDPGFMPRSTVSEDCDEKERLEKSSTGGAPAPAATVEQPR